MFNIEQLQQKITNLTASRKFLIAYSGGMDSHVLLYGMAKLATNNNFKIRAAHIHHGLSQNANAWVAHCHEVCDKLNVELLVEHVDVKSKLTKRHSPESIARELRYQKLAQLLCEDECLVVAHHLNDQAETLFLQLFRGAGVKGLAAMPECKDFGNSVLIRPLLDFNREQLYKYAIQHNLKWIEDESNENIGIDRNYIRHKLLPTIKHRWPNILNTLKRVTENCAQGSELLDILASQDYNFCQGQKPNTIAISKLLQLSEARQNNVIRYWLHQLKIPSPSNIKLQHIKHDILTAKQDANPCVHWHKAEVRRFRDELYAMLPLAAHDPTIIIPWDGKTELELPNNMGLLKPELLQELKLDLAQILEITIRFRHDGSPAGLKKTFQEQAIPPWLRDRVPLLCVKDKSAAQLKIIPLKIFC